MQNVIKVSHYFSYLSSMISGSSSHKKIDEKQSWYLRMYYTNNVSYNTWCNVRMMLTENKHIYCG
jgi:hypothetical protein